jgi:hypothetical protein
MIGGNLATSQKRLIMTEMCKRAIGMVIDARSDHGGYAPLGDFH